MSYSFFVKSNINFGIGAVSVLPELLGKYGLNKIMLVYDSGVKAAGIAEKVIAQIEKAKVSYVIFDGVIPNPTNEVVESAAKLAKAENVNGFVAVGGGSSIDTAKAVNVLMTNPGSIGEYGGMNMVKNPCFPLIAIPTTAGTSSEITNVSALIDTEKVEIKEDKLTGLTPQLTELKKNAPFLFEKKLMYLTGYSPEASSDLIPKINTADMTYSQAVAFLDN